MPLSNLQRAYTAGDQKAASTRLSATPMRLKDEVARLQLRHESSPARSNASNGKRSDTNSIASSTGGWDRCCRSESRVRDYDGSHWVTGDVADKVGGRDDFGWLSKKPQLGGFTTRLGAEKVTGDQSTSGIIAERKNAKNAPIASRPGQSLIPRTKRSLTHGTELQKPAWEVTPKIVSADRQWKKPTEDLARSVVNTDRDSSKLLNKGHQTIPDNFKVHTLNPSSSAPTLLQEAAAGLSRAERIAHSQKVDGYN